MSYQETLKVNDAINGRLGSVYLIKDGERRLMMEVKDVTANFKKNKKEIPVLGASGAKHKATGWSGSGSMTVYYGSSTLREAAIKYINTGVDSYYELVITNEDPSSNIGRQTITLTGVNFDDAVLAKLDVNNSELDEQINFTFHGCDMLEKFSEYVGE